MSALAERVDPVSIIDWEELAAPFPPHEVKQRQGPGGRMLSYVDARLVAQRLDDVVTPPLWEFTCSVIPGTDIVKGRLVIAGIVREDHGYPNSDRDEEPIKAATSDALKRCAVLFGIGRHLYEDNQHSTPRSTPPAGRTATASTPPRPVAVPNPYDEPPEIAASFAEARPGDPDSLICPDHRKPYRQGKNGNKYCATNLADGSWCPQPVR